MTKKSNRILSLFLVFALALTLFSGLAVVKSEAASFPTGHPNTYKNTGVGANDIIGVARTQIGYQENYYGTKYGDWYNGIFVNQPWCAMFVSWCAKQAGIPETVIAKYAACGTEVEWFKAIGRWHDSKAFGGNYTPKKGDVIFYRDAGSNCISTHTGLVAGLNGNYIITIEGNSTNSAVCEFRTSTARSLDNSYVIGYGEPNYSNTMSMENEPDTHEKWQVLADGLTLRAKADTSSNRLAVIPYATVVNVKKFKLSGGYLWGYLKYNGKKGWVALDFCEYICGSINGEFYQLAPTVTPAKKTLYLGYTTTLTVTNGRGATFESSDPEIASVSKKGKVTALKAGTVKITCTTKTGSVTSKIKVKNPNLNTETASVAVGDKISLSVEHAKGDVTWATSDSSIVKVGKTGNIKGMSPGTATVSATVSGLTLSCAVTVTEFPTTYERFTVLEDKTYVYESAATNAKKLKKIPVDTQIKVTDVEYSDTYTWGKTTYGSAEGYVILNRCKYENGTIDGTAHKARPFLAKTSKNIYITSEYEVPLRSAEGHTTYKSSSEEVATVNSKGVVTGHKHGSATITVVNSGHKMKIKINVKNPRLTAEKLELVKDNTAVLGVKGGNSEIVWTSSDEEIAKVAEDGTVTAVSYGTATITAVRNGIELNCEVSVYDPTITPTSATVEVGKTKTLKVSQSSDSAVQWKSSKTEIAKVNSKGKVTAVKAGSAKITAKVDGVTLKCKVKVKAA